MPRIVFGSAIARHAAAAGGGELACAVRAGTLGDALAEAFRAHPALRGYVLDEHGRVRHHVAVFVDGESITDKSDLGIALGDDAEVYLMQALSGG